MLSTTFCCRPCRRRLPVKVDAVEIFKGWVADVTRDYDPSHAVQHFERVDRMALELAAVDRRFAREDTAVLRLAAWAHDVCDHKLCPRSKASSREAAMRAVLVKDCHLTMVNAQRVLVIADNISLSKEKVGKLDRALLQQYDCEVLRDLVSDADKLDALGRQGLQRLVEHHAASFSRLADLGSMPTLREDMRRLAKQHLLPRRDYLRTPAAIERGGGLIAEMQSILDDDEALTRLCEQTLETMAINPRSFKE